MRTNTDSTSPHSGDLIMSTTSTPARETLHAIAKRLDLTLGPRDGLIVAYSPIRLDCLLDWELVSDDRTRQILRPRENTEQEYCTSCGWLGCNSACDLWES